MPASFVPPTQAFARDERCGSVAVLGCAGNLTILAEKRCAEIIGKIDAPKPPALSDSEALKLALAGLRIDAISTTGVQRGPGGPCSSWNVSSMVARQSSLASSA